VLLQVGRTLVLSPSTNRFMICLSKTAIDPAPQDVIKSRIVFGGDLGGDVEGDFRV
jgi:hypothetical protein